MANIRRDIIDQNVCVLTFDRPNSSENFFDRATLLEFGQRLEDLSNIEPPLRGLIITSAKADVFVGGSDLQSLRQMTHEELGVFIELGQRVFAKLDDLAIPSVAAIHGAAVSGGCELALACDWRVASPDSCTRIGLPETTIGLVPAWGGCWRLPRLIGMQRALDLILPGKIVNSHDALTLELVDEVTAHGNFTRTALALLERGKHPSTLKRSAAVNVVLDTLIAPRIRHDVEKQTHGNYPAVRKAMDVVMQAASAWTERSSMSIERDAIYELFGTPVTKHLLSHALFEQQVKKRVAASAGEGREEIGKTAVIGAGVMGAGIAQWLSARGWRVILRDLHPVRIAAGFDSICALFSESVKRHDLTELEARAGLDRISPAVTDVPLSHVDLVVEAALEKLPIKQDILRRLDAQLRPDALLATNTSALSITQLASVTQHPGRVLGLHFFNPVHKMQLVEVVAARGTAPEAVQRALRFVHGIGKLPIVVEDSPGFLVNRILLPYLIEATVLFGEGASIGAIDDAMEKFGMPMGPLALIDAIGVDVVEEIANALHAAWPNRFTVPEIFSRMVISGTLGRKTGKGFHDHAGESPANAELGAAPRGAREFTPEEIERRLVFAMLNEAARCLEEGVVGSAAEVDAAMVAGAGWAPFRGGPLRYADTLGVTILVAELSRLATTLGSRFAPGEHLAEMARQNGRFYPD